MASRDKKNFLHDIMNFLSTFFVALVVIIALLLLVGRLLGIHLFNVESGSMSPAYPAGSLIVVTGTDPGDIEEGDVITYVMNKEGMVVTHRVVSVDVENRTFKTKGDANNVEDAVPVAWDNMVGKVMFGVPAMGSALAVMTAEENRNVMIGIIAGLLILSLVIDISKKKNTAPNEKNDLYKDYDKKLRKGEVCDEEK